jgi:hypothetical protein
MGFNRVFADMLRMLDRYKHADISVPISEAATIRAFFRKWAAELTNE